ncbi:MAG: archaellin/type IV pilin N-terminal domain-containing protein [Nitrososphaerota archaeon]
MTGKGKSGISPVVATVILVAVAIVIAIAVAFWASGLVGVFTRFEKLEIVSAVMIDENTFQVRIRNTGSADTQIIQVVVQGRSVGTPNPPVQVKVGQMVTCTVGVQNSPPPGITVELAFHSAGGKVYPTAVLATLGNGGNEAWDPGAIALDCGGGGGGGGGGGSTTTTTTTTTTTATTTT